MKKNIISRLLAITLLIAFIVPAFNVFADVPNEPNNYGQVVFGGNITNFNLVNNASSVTIEYDHGDVIVTGSGIYTGINSTNNNKTLYATGNITVTAAPDPGYTSTLWKNGSNLNSNTTTFEATVATPLNVDAVFEDQNNQGGGQGGPQQIPGGTLTSSTFTYTNTGNDPADFWVNNTEIGVGQAPAADPMEYYYDSSTNKVTFKFATFVNNRLTSITINNTSYTSQLPTTKDGWLEANENQVDAVYIEVPYAANYDIVTTTTRDFDWSIGNFLWSNDCDPRDDNYIKNGKVEFVSLKYKGTTYSSLAELRNANKNYLFFDELEAGETDGAAVLPAGAELTVKLIPDRGYQLTSFSCNGQEFASQEEIGTYTFTVPGGNFHWGAKFTKVDNKVVSTADFINGGSISVSNDEDSMAMGTAKLNLKEADDVSPTQKGKFKDATTGYELGDIIDIKLYNTVYKGTPDSSWDTQVNNLSKKAKITIKLKEKLNGNDAVIAHEKHDGTIELIDAEYDEENMTVTFETDGFSNYAIGARTIDKKNVKTGDNVSIYFICLITSLIGLATLKIFKKANVK